jgi:16S rRNA (uracil1498-N3)-methyltransferase
MTGEEWHHAYQVLRMNTGQSLILFDGKGKCMEGILHSTTKSEGHIELLRDRKDDFWIDRPYRLSIAFAPTKNIDRTEFAVEKLVELGVDEICFLTCQHSERTKIRLDRIEKIVLSAGKQSRKILLPVIRDFISPSLLVSQTKEKQPETLLLCCHLDTTSKSVTQNYSPGRDVLMLIGPEGGFTEDEIGQMKQSGAHTVTIGPYRLRVETAAIAACAAIHILNDLKKP